MPSSVSVRTAGHVERARQRRAQAHQPLEVAVVVLRHVQPAGRDDVDRRVVEQRGRGQQPLLDRKLVEERLERRAGLPRGLHAVDEACAGRPPAVADVGQHLAAGGCRPRAPRRRRRSARRAGRVGACTASSAKACSLAVQRGGHATRFGRHQLARHVRREGRRRPRFGHAGQASPAPAPPRPSQLERGLEGLRQRAGALGDHRRLRVGSAQQHRQDQRLVFVQPAGHACRTAHAPPRPHPAPRRERSTG